MAGSFVLAEILLTVSDLFKGELQENLMYNLAGCLVSLGLVLIYYALTFLCLTSWARPRRGPG